MPFMTGSHLTVLGLALCGMAWLAGCSTPATVGEYPNQQRVAGQSKAAILTCAGAPKKEIEESGLTLLRYYREAPILEESQPVGKGSVSTIRHGCWATVIFQNDRVVDVHYRFVPPTFDASNDCEEIFESCGQ
ncbi:MAG: hypothetical protein BVN28_14580 [Nitrospira sp. ST-bin4]|jgi:hypothetical protein|nr:MAG: hypothetical protein BVN28_14580 [Nitrospira sp. ST-bin4]